MNILKLCNARKRSLAVCVLLLLFAAFASVACSNLATQESVLLSFKNALENPGALSSWSPQTTHACSGNWRGVICNNAQTSITNLTLEGDDFTGHIPNEIRQMKFLKTLTIRKTAFLGAIPQAIADLRHLKNLIIENNPRLTGSFPTWIIDLKHLEILYLAGNNLTSSIFCNSSQFNQSLALPVTGSVAYTVPLPRYTDANVTLNNMPVVVLTHVNLTFPTVTIPIVWFLNYTQPNLTGLNSPHLTVMFPNISLPSPANITLYASNWTVQPFPIWNWTIPSIDFPNLPPPITFISDETLQDCTSLEYHTATYLELHELHLQLDITTMLLHSITQLDNATMKCHTSYVQLDN